MGVDVHHYIFYGIKMPSIIIEDDEFGDMLFDNHDPKWCEKIDPDKIYVLFDFYCAKYTMIGYVIDKANHENGFNFNEIDNLGEFDNDKIIDFLKQDGFPEFEEIPEPKLYVFTHWS